MKEVRFVGDMPHGWVASEFIRSALDLFAYERTSDEAVVLGAGIPAAWLQGPGIAVRGLRTRYGVLNYSAKMRGVRVQVRIARGSTPPPGGFVLAFPGQEAPAVARVNGRIVNATELRVRNIPAEIVLEAR
jgi:hypothetical protein